MQKLLILLSILTLNLNANWSLINFDNQYNLAYTNEKKFTVSSLFLALEKIEKENAELGSIGFYSSNDIENMTKELHSYYKKEIPTHYKKAMNSSGNMHNPALDSLLERYDLAIKSTTFYKNIEKELNEHGYFIIDIDHEKFSMDTKKKPYGFYVNTHLSIQKKVKSSTIMIECTSKNTLRNERKFDATIAFSTITQIGEEGRLRAEIKDINLSEKWPLKKECQSPFVDKVLKGYTWSNMTNLLKGEEIKLSIIDNKECYYLLFVKLGDGKVSTIDPFINMKIQGESSFLSHCQRVEVKI